MFSATILHGENSIWLLFWGGLVVGPLLYLLLGKIRPRKAAETVRATPIEENLAEPPRVCFGIPPDVLARIHDACGGQIKDGELDIRFELRSRRDCDKMVAMMREMTEGLERTNTFIDGAEADARAQLHGQLTAAKQITGRIIALGGRPTQPVVLPAHREQYIAAKQAELDGYGTARKLVNKFINELGGAEASILALPFYANSNTATIPLPRMSDEPRVA